MSTPATLLHFFQQEATENLDRLDALVAAAGDAAPEPAAFLASCRALHGGATMARLPALPALAAAVERIADALRAGTMRWDDRLRFALHGAVVELRALVARVHQWGDAEQRRCRAQAAALAAVAAVHGEVAPVVPVHRLFPDDDQPPVLHRNPEPPVLVGQRFRAELAGVAGPVLRAPAASPALREALGQVEAVATGYGADAIGGLAAAMAAALPMPGPAHDAIRAFARVLADRALGEAELAARVKAVAVAWTAATGATAAPPEPVVPIDTLLYRGPQALARARAVRDALRDALATHGPSDPRTTALLDELSDLLDLAASA